MVRQIIDLIQLKTNPGRKEEVCLSSPTCSVNQLVVEGHEQGLALAKGGARKHGH